jgi:hypothetical protein
MFRGGTEGTTRLLRLHSRPLVTPFGPTRRHRLPDNFLNKSYKLHKCIFFHWISTVQENREILNHLLHRRGLFLFLFWPIPKLRSERPPLCPRAHARRRRLHSTRGYWNPSSSTRFGCLHPLPCGKWGTSTVFWRPYIDFEVTCFSNRGRPTINYEIKTSKVHWIIIHRLEQCARPRKILLLPCIFDFLIYYALLCSNYPGSEKKYCNVTCSC